jgi:hypothetical protein
MRTTLILPAVRRCLWTARPPISCRIVSVAALTSLALLAHLPSAVAEVESDSLGVVKEASALQHEDSDKDSLLRAAIFVQNNAGPQLDSSVSAFRDMLSARLADKGFSVMDQHDIIKRFAESTASSDQVADAVNEMSKMAKFDKTESSIDQVLNGASAVRIAQMLDANYIIVATLSSLGEEKRSFNGEGTLYKTSNQVLIRTLRVSIRVLEGNQGGSVYGDTVAVSKKYGGVEHLSIESSDTNNALVDDAALTLANNIAKKISSIRDAKVNTLSMAEVTLTSNVEGASVEVDGAVIGTVPGSFAIKPGLHQIAVSKEWYSTWKRTINVVPNQVIAVTLERSKEGQARYEESLRVQREDDLLRKKTDAEIEIAKQQSEAEAFAKKKVAEGESEFRKNSHTQIEGEVGTLNIEPRPDAMIKIDKE